MLVMGIMGILIKNILFVVFLYEWIQHKQSIGTPFFIHVVL